MKRLSFFTCLVLTIILSSSIQCDSGASKVKIGNEFFNKIVSILTHKIINEANKYKDNLPELKLDTTVLKWFTLNATLMNFSYNELVYEEKQFQISHKDGDIINIKLGKIISF